MRERHQQHQQLVVSHLHKAVQRSASCLCRALLSLLLLFIFSNSLWAQKRLQVTTGKVETGSGKLYYEMAGKGDKVVVLIHGGLADSRLWDDQFREFAKHFRVVRYDLRGFGKSDYSMGPLSHVEDLATLLKALDIKRASLVGLSLGGIISVDFALEHPEMVERLVLAASGLRGHRGVGNEKGKAVQEAAEKEGMERAIALWLEHPFFATGSKNPAYQRRMREMLTDNFRTWGPTPKPIIWTWPTTPSIERLQDIKQPTLVIVGDQDFIDILSIADILSTRIAGAKKAVIKGVSHHLNMERQKEFNRLVLDFLSH